jgi:hypothetical protein
MIMTITIITIITITLFSLLASRLTLLLLHQR